LKIKHLSKIVLVLFVFSFLIGCGDDPVTPPAPTAANVTISGQTLTTTWFNALGAGTFTLSGILTNSGESTAYNVQVQVTLRDASSVVLHVSPWFTVFTSLSGGSSLGFNKMWNYYNRALESAYYSVAINWTTSAAAAEEMGPGEGESSYTSGPILIEK